MQTIENINIAQLLAGITFVDPEWERVISGLALDSRQVKKGDLFIANVGLQIDARDYIPEAIAHGAVAVVAEAGLALKDTLMQNVPVFAVENLFQHVSKIAARFYGHPSRHLKMVGVTGTNGKTSCTHFLAQALQQINMACGLLGTLGYGTLNKLTAGLHTTPDAVLVQQVLAKLYANGVNTVAMEVSSHALIQERVKHVEFDIGIFTNLTHEHLDYHGDMTTYGKVKQKLFEQFGLHHAVINYDDAFGKTLLTQLPQSVKSYSFSVQAKQADIYVKKLIMHPTGLQATVVTPWGTGELTSPLLGRFNLSNLLAVLTILCILEIPLAKALVSLQQVTGVAGRMQCLTQAEQPLVVIDYAHTPDALQQVLRAIREHCQGQLYCVFGCGGDRDKAKRPLMGSVVEAFADHVVITNDNPRNEEPQQIIAAVQQGLKNPKAANVEPDRRVAIAAAIATAGTEDIVLIAGKGHETYQQIGDKRFPFSDAAVVAEIFAQQPDYR